jgi:hypothetical protein
MADRKLIEEYKLSEAVKRFQQINEYTFISAPPLTEDGEDGQNGDASQQQPQQGAEDPNVQQPMPNDGQGGGQQPPMGANGQQPMDAQGGDEQQIPMDGQQQPPMNMPQDGQPPMEDDMSQMQPDDEVIDVDDLTDAQEETEEKVDGVNTKLLRLFKVVSKYTDAIEKQNQEIEDLKAEFEKRNPTEEERLNLRSQAGYPYSEQPKDFWNKKTRENPNYNVMYDNEVPTDKEQEKFEIKRKDLDGMNYKEIADSFDKYPQELTDYINF